MTDSEHEEPGGAAYEFGSDAEQGTLVEWTPSMLRRFTAAEANSNGDYFTFDGIDFYRRYARYLIEYLNDAFAVNAR